MTEVRLRFDRRSTGDVLVVEERRQGGWFVVAEFENEFQAFEAYPHAKWSDDGWRKSARGRERKLTAAEEDKVCALYATGELSKAALCQRFGVSVTVISAALRRRSA